MKITFRLHAGACAVIICWASLAACSKSGSDEPTDPCLANPLTVTPTLTKNPDACTSTGIITVNATGGAGLSFRIDNGSFQSSNVFNGIAPGNHTVTVRTSAGCTQTATINAVASGAGPLFTAVKAVVAANCAVAGCHSGTNPAASKNFGDDCVVAANHDLIKARAVDAAGTANQMPQPPRDPLSQADRDKISAWVAAGGAIGD